MGSYETVLGGVVGSPVEDVDTPVFEHTHLFGQQNRDEPSTMLSKVLGSDVPEVFLEETRVIVEDCLAEPDVN